MDICKAVHAFYVSLFSQRYLNNTHQISDFTFDIKNHGIEYIEGPPTPQLHKTYIYPPKPQKFEN